MNAALPTPRFAADHPLGGLARRLRLLGFDVLWPVDLEGFRNDARMAGRIPLTRTRRMRRLSLPGLIFIGSDPPRRQVLEVLNHLQLGGSDLRPMTRCADCNLRLHDLDSGSAAHRVPEYVRRHHRRFRNCPGCGRVFWRGTHYARFMEEVARYAPAVERREHR